MVQSVTKDGFLNGKVILVQPKSGFRSGIDSIFLASSIFPKSGDTILDVGCGVGTVGILILNRWIKDMNLHVTGVEKVLTSKKLAEENSLLNGVDSSFEVVTEDVLTPEGVLKSKGFTQVVTNPPFFYERQEFLEGNADKRQAKSITPENLWLWMDYCIKRVAPRGTLTLIIPPERLAEILDVMKNRLGRIRIFPLWATPGGCAKRLLIQGVKGARTPLVILPGDALRISDKEYTSFTEQILRTGIGFSWEV